MCVFNSSDNLVNKMICHVGSRYSSMSEGEEVERQVKALLLQGLSKQFVKPHARVKAKAQLCFRCTLARAQFFSMMY